MNINIVVLVEHESLMRAGVETAWSARPLGFPVYVVAPRSAPRWGLPENVTRVDAGSDVAVTTFGLLPDQGAVLILNAGEILGLEDPVAAARSLTELPTGTPFAVTTPTGLDQRGFVAQRLRPQAVLDAIWITALVPPAPVTPPTAHPLATAPTAEPAPAEPAAPARTAPVASSSGALPSALPVAQLIPPHPTAEQFAAAAAGDAAAQERLADLFRVPSDQAMLSWARNGRPAAISEVRDPLVTVRISTYNRGPLVVQRSITSALCQTYKNVEVLVVGDNCDDATAAAVLRVEDPRVRFVNLPARGLYPPDAADRWRVAGADPANAGLMLARGEWIAPLDDDDEFTPDHVEVLLRAAQEGQFEMVYSISDMENRDGSWRKVGAQPLREGNLCHGSVMFSSQLRFMHYSRTCFRMGRPADFTLWERMSFAGVRIGFVPHTTFVHFEEARELR